MSQEDSTPVPAPAPIGEPIPTTSTGVPPEVDPIEVTPVSTAEDRAVQWPTDLKFEISSDPIVKSGTPDVLHVTLPPVEVPAVEDAAAEVTIPEMAAITPASTVRQDYEIEKKGSLRTDGQLDTAIETMAMPAATVETQDVNLRHPGAKDLDTAKAQTWAGILEQGQVPRLNNGVLIPSTLRLESKWLQGLDTGNGRLGYSSPKFAEKDGVKLNGDLAMIRLRALLGGGGLVQVPLWHSGFHITLKTPKDSAILELRERNEQAKINLGRVTFGMVYSNTAGYLVENVVDMILEHVYSTTLKDSKNLRDKISVLDLPILIWGIACCIWPNGFQYARSSVSAEGISKKEIITALVDVAKLMWVDQTAFTERQKAHMSNRQPEQITEDMRKIYQDQFVSTAGRTIQLKGEQVTLGLRVPSLAQYIQTTHAWVDSLVDIIDRTFTGDRSDIEGRNRSILDHANLSRMRQYGHFIEKVTMDGVDYNDPENIDQMLEVLSGIKDVQRPYYKGIEDFVNDSTAALIAIPETSGKETDLPRYPHLIPIDALGVFFSLLMHRISRILPTEE